MYKQILVSLARSSSGWLFFFLLIVVITGCSQAEVNIQPGQWTTLGAGLTLHTMPSPSSKPLYVTQKNKKYRVINEENNWIAVVDQEGTIGWLHAPAVYASTGGKKKEDIGVATRLQEPEQVLFCRLYCR